MIPCTTTEIHRWNALDDLDDDISDRVNDDLIPNDDDFDENEDEDLAQYEDPSLLLIDSLISSDSTVDDTNQTNDRSSDFSSYIDEDGLILALDDSTNRMTRKRQDGVTSTSKSPNTSSRNDIVTVRVKRSVKYGSQENSTKRNIRMTAANKKDIIRPLAISSNHTDIVPSDIYTMYSDGTMNSLTPTEEELNERKNNVMTVRVKKSVKYGNKENAITNYNSRDVVQRPHINTIHSDGTISSSLTADKNIEPKVASIRSDGTIAYSDEKNSAIIEKPAQRIATINSDGTISYRIGSNIGRNETALIMHQPSSKIATIHSDGLISYSSVEAKHSPTLHTSLTSKTVSFENIVTDSEDYDADDNGGDEDMDDDICDNVDDSRYTRSLHSMPVLEEVTEEESPLHSESRAREEIVSSTPKQPLYEEQPSWIELKPSPSATTFMTPRRSNDEWSNDEEFRNMSDALTSSWLGLKGFASLQNKYKNGAKYQSMEENSTVPSVRKPLHDATKGSWKNATLRVETCSTSSHTEKFNSPNDMESISNSGASRSLSDKFASSRGGYRLSDGDEGSLPNKTKAPFCFRRREWTVAIVLVLIGVIVGVASFFIMHRIFIEGEDREKGLTEEWTMIGSGSPLGTIGDTSGFDSDVSLLSMTPSEAPIAPLANGKFLAITDTSVMKEVVRRARREIEILIFDDDDLIGKFLRLAFHDCVGGCDGCVDMTNPKNNGLNKPIDALQPIVDEFEREGLSRTDIWMMASLVASELALPFESSDLLFPMHWVGRQTCESRFANRCGVDFLGNPTICSSTRGPHVEQPHGGLGTKSMLKFFENEFGFNAQQVTAIMGAHSVGQMARENVGFMGLWDLSTTTLDTGYWQELVGTPPDFFVETVDNSDLPNIPDRHQWRGIVTDMDFKTVVMLNVDVALVRNVEDMDENGNVGCAGPGILLKDCPPDTPFLPFAKQYNADERKFLMDFRDVLTLMVNHGNASPTDLITCPEGRICVFENGQRNFGTAGLALDELSMPPTPSPTGAPTLSPTRAPPKSFPQVALGEPVVSLDRICYNNIGDILVVKYDSVFGTDITLQVFSADDVDIFGDEVVIDPLVAINPLKSSLSCGLPSCHTWTSLGGLQISTENLEGGGADYVVLLFARKSGDPNGNLVLLTGDSFRLEGCND